MNSPDLTTPEGRLAAADPRMRRREARRLASRREPILLETLRTRLAAEDDPHVTVALLEAVAACHPSAAPELCAGRLWDTNPIIRVAAIDALAMVGGMASLRGLKAVLEDESPRVRVAAAAALINHGLLDAEIHLDQLISRKTTESLTEAVNIIARLDDPSSVSCRLGDIFRLTRDTTLIELVRFTKERLDGPKNPPTARHTDAPPPPSWSIVAFWSCFAIIALGLAGFRWSGNLKPPRDQVLTTLEAESSEAVNAATILALTRQGLSPERAALQTGVDLNRTLNLAQKDRFRSLVLIPNGVIPPSPIADPVILTHIVHEALERGKTAEALELLQDASSVTGSADLAMLVVEAVERISAEKALDVLDSLAEAGVISDVLRARRMSLEKYLGQGDNDTSAFNEDGEEPRQ